jgi:hypothetical protein
MVGGCKNVGDVIPCSYTSHNDRFHRMFRNGNYDGASNAFQRAGHFRESRICDAYDLQEKAALTSTTARPIRIQAFVTAAEAFLNCAQDSPLRQVKERLTCYEAAGDCYKEARDLKSAADKYRLAEKYDKVALAHQESGDIEEMVAMITQHQKILDDSLHKRLTAEAQMHYFKVHLNGSFASEHR